LLLPEDFSEEISVNCYITHSVYFRLKHRAGSIKEKEFIESCQRILSPIPGVEAFRVLRQTSAKNNFDFGLTMDFGSQSAYDAYNNHPDHVEFVRGIWIPNVEDFMEIDYTENY